jgi:hypothetical protein
MFIDSTQKTRGDQPAAAAAAPSAGANAAAHQGGCLINIRKVSRLTPYAIAEGSITPGPIKRAY